VRGVASAIELGLLSTLVAHLGCSRADLYPITEQAPAAGSPGSAGRGGSDAGGAGGASAGGSGSSGDTSVGGGGTGAAGGSTGTCPTAVAPPGDTTRSVSVDGTMRSYVLHVPSTYDGKNPVPLVVDFHGVGDSGLDEAASSPYPARLDPEGVVMAFPNGLRGPAGTAWNVGPCCVEAVDDVAFARAVVTDVQARACVDPARVYAVGVLTGGGMAHYLACHAADVFAAVAPAAFDLLEENLDDCTPPRPVTVVSFRGTAPSRVPYEGGYSSAVPGLPVTFLGARRTFEEWARIDGCTGNPSAPDANGCEGYSACSGDVEVILCTKVDGIEDPGDPDIAWPVLARHTL
jgi:polyhydroxybutyrate depolymerase